MSGEHRFDEASSDDEPDESEMGCRGDECGRWDNGRLVRHCALAGTEFCDFDCPYGSDHPEARSR